MFVTQLSKVYTPNPVDSISPDLHHSLFSGFTLNWIEVASDLAFAAIEGKFGVHPKSMAYIVLFPYNVNVRQ